MVSGVYRSRFGRPLDDDVLSYISSLRDDSEIFLEDIVGSEAHAVMLYEQGIIGREDARMILEALEALKREWAEGRIDLEAAKLEDVHEFVEAYLIDRIGVEVGGKLHTGRSRNDQVALDIRLRLRHYLLGLWEEILNAMEKILSRAEEEKETLIIHYTHLQHAQIGYLSHYLLALFDHLLRDLERMEACYKRVNMCPLGASAIAGSDLPLNRLRVAELLGFDGIVENSIDSVSSRDFALEALSISAILMVNLSRFSEDLITWSSSEFGYIELPDELASPSSIMPHKKNPCILELIRAKAGRVCGALTALLMELKGIPIGYDRDLQENKPLIWDGLRETHRSLKIFSKIVEKVRFRRDRMLENASSSFAPAIDLAEALIEYSNLSLREAHRVVGMLVRKLVDNGLELKDVDENMLREVAEEVLGKEVKIPGEALKVVQDVSKIPMKRKTMGSPNPSEISRMIMERKRILKKKRGAFREVLKRLEESGEMLNRSISEITRSKNE